MAARSEQQNQFVDATLFVAAQKVPHGGRATDRTPVGAVDDARILLDLFEMPLPDTGPAGRVHAGHVVVRSEEHTSELQSLMRISYAVFCLKKKHHNTNT